MKRTAIIICSLIIAAVIAGTALTLASPSDKKDLISSEKALSIALADAGIAAENAADVKSVLSEDDSEHFFEVEFDSGENEYDYKISAEDGSIISRKVEADKEDDVNDTSVQTDNKQTASSGTESTSAFIGVDKAKSIALSDAKVKASEATFTKAKLDKDDGGYEYEIDFRSGGTEYEYSINAKTGKIIEKDVEKLSSGSKTTTTTKAQESTSAFIGVDKAKSIALSDAKVKASEATFIKAKLDKDDGVYEYEIDFRSGNTEYEYSINAKTGKIIEKDVEKLSSGNKTTTTTKAQESTSAFIGVDKAKSIALSDAKVKASEATFIKAKLDKDDGVYEYEIDFRSGNTEYEYSINAKTGKIIEKDVEKLSSGSKTTTTTKAQTGESYFIGVDKAKSIALSHAKISEKDARFKKVKLEKDDGIYEYDVEFVSGGMEYEYSINAKTGKIIDFEKDSDD